MEKQAEKYNLRQTYIEELIRLAEINPRIVSLDSDSKEATFADRFLMAYPERSFTFGIAEQDMVSAAAGMATMGLIPFVNSYALFIAMRALDQLRNSVAYPNLNVKFVLSHHGLDSGADGITHQLTEDIAIFRSIPNLKMLQPADAIEMRQMVRFAMETDGPVIIKSGKTSVPNFHDENYVWQYGVPSLIMPGTKVALIATGIMLDKTLNAHKMLKDEGLDTRLLHFSSFTDLNIAIFLDMIHDIDLIVTVEDHSIHGGLGGLIAETCSQFKPTRVLRVGLKSQFAECGSPSELFAKYAMDEHEIVRQVKENL